MFKDKINSFPIVHQPSSRKAPSSDSRQTNSSLVSSSEIYDVIRDIKDPEHPFTLEELMVVKEDLISVTSCENYFCITIYFVPTVPHCSLAALIGLCIRKRICQSFSSFNLKITILISPGSHQTEEEVNKQINDKERVQAAMENPNLYSTVLECVGSYE